MNQSPVTQIFGQTQAVSPITPDEFDSVIQNRVTPLSEYWGSVFKSAAEHTTPGAYYQAQQVPQNDLGAPVYPLEQPAPGATVITQGGSKYGAYRYERTDVPYLTPEQYKASEWFRPGIPDDGRMTEARAKAKAEIYDADQYRTWLRQNRPWGLATVGAATTATLAGGAIDPSNYIPVFGLGFRAANMTRIEVMMARAGIMALNAGAVTAITEPYIASSRRQFGEDVSFSDQILDIALGAATGGLFGLGHGALERIHIDDLHPTKVEAKLQTLGEAADAIANDRPVDVGGAYRRSLLSGTALSRPDVQTDFRVPDPSITPQDRAVAAWQGKVESVAREAEPQAWNQRDALLDQQDALRQQLEATPRANISDIDAKIDYARGQYFDAPYKDKPKYQRALNALYAERDAQAHGALLNEDTPQQAGIRQQLQAVDAKLRDIAPVISASLKKGEAVHPRPELPEAPRATGTVEQNFGKGSLSPFDQAMQDTADLPRVARTVAALDTVVPEAPKTAPEVLAKADAAVGKPQTFATDAGAKEIATEHGVNPESGDFEEMADIKRLADAEQLTAAETKSLKEADATIKRTDDYAKAYQAAAACLGRA